MPVYRFLCPVCGLSDKRLLKPAQAAGPHSCRKTPECPGILLRDVKPPSMVAKEIIDNGVMVRRVERDIDCEKLVHDRAKKDYRNR